MSTENEKDNLTKPSSTGVVFSSPQSVAPFVYKLFKQGVPRKKVEKMLKKCNFTFDVTHLDTEEIVKIIVNDIYMQKAYKGTEKTLLVYKKEIDFIKNQVNDANKLAALDIMSKHKKNITHLLFSFLVYSRYDD